MAPVLLDSLLLYFNRSALERLTCVPKLERPFPMGTDIHAFVEHCHAQGGEPFSDPDRIYSFNAGEFRISQDYDLFNALGDGRNYSLDEAARDQPALFSPRGLPQHISEEVANRYYHFVDNRGFTITTWPALPTVTRQEAEQWVAENRAQYGKSLRSTREIRRVSHPYWHSASWLTLQEIYQSLDSYNIQFDQLPLEFQIVVDIMKQFEQELGQGKTRLVFWFDS